MNHLSIRPLFLFGLLVLLGSNILAQPQGVDSLNIAYKEAKHDTLRIPILLDIARANYLYNPDTALLVCEEALVLAEKGTSKKRIADAYGWLAILEKNRGHIELALDYGSKYIRMLQQLLLEKEALGTPEAEKRIIKIKNGIAGGLNNTALIYQVQGDISQAKEAFEESLRLRREVKNQSGIGTALNNLGIIYMNEGEIEQSLKYHKEALEIRKGLKDQARIAQSLHNIGQCYEEQLKFAEALEYYEQCLTIHESSSNKRGLSLTLHNIAGILILMEDLEGAKEYARKSMELAQSIGFPHIIQGASNMFYMIHKQQGEYEAALIMYEQFILMRDSVKNDETQKATIRQQTQYEFEKAALVKEQEEKEASRIVAEETSRRDNLQYSIILLGLLVLGSLVLGLGKLSVSTRMAEGLIFFSFLILFEFILVLADPYVDVWTGGAPGWKLLINAAIAALIFPLHAFFETKLKGRLVKQ